MRKTKVLNLIVFITFHWLFLSSCENGGLKKAKSKNDDGFLLSDSTSQTIVQGTDQNQDLDEYPRYDSISYKDIFFKGLPLYSKSDLFYSALGEPDSAVPWYNEISDDNGFRYYYDGYNVLYDQNGSLIDNQGFCVYFNSDSLCDSFGGKLKYLFIRSLGVAIGDKVAKIEHKLPLSFRRKKYRNEDSTKYYIALYIYDALDPTLEQYISIYVNSDTIDAFSIWSW